MHKEKIKTLTGYLLLAKVGKRVLRPGGKELTKRMLDLLNITKNDEVVEFAPGWGFTAHLSLSQNPKSYTGIDSDERFVALLNKRFLGSKAKFKLGEAANTGLPNESADKVYGEAMLSMHIDHRKDDIINEAYRILKPGGLYAIHELVLKPDDMKEDERKKIQYDLAQAMKVNARPHVIAEWESLLQQEGFRIEKVEYAPMRLLQPLRLIDDEGFLGFLKITKNIIFNPEIKKRVIFMRETFKKYEPNLQAVLIIAKKETKI